MPHRFIAFGPATEVEPVNMHTREDECDGFDDEVSKRQDDMQRQQQELMERLKASCPTNQPN